MPLSRLAEFSPRAPLLSRAVAAAALIAGLLGMHVLMSPASHAAHGRMDAAHSVISSMSGAAQPHHGVASVPSTPPSSAAKPAPDHMSCTSVCADPAIPGSSHGQDESTWSVICVLALLLTALLLMPPWRSRVLSWRLMRLAVRQTVADGDRAPRHPPSLHLLSISRT
jgi:hypothetical protein